MGIRDTVCPYLPASWVNRPHPGLKPWAMFGASLRDGLSFCLRRTHSVPEGQPDNSPVF
ncbi:hypothetical protein H206_05385 [Candidatus Electrothrix aarhusensis]|uniref:Uncharacterized protein n=1 Tax=Candidatus Electrothrix aarhusensis TaxID=1859131 RepID=A0A444J4M8_9BACT|nr:hypothetical protein H206_05385 [Candidatus Electrothrix aarhusensis]